MIATPTVDTECQRGDVAHVLARNAYIERDTDTLRTLAESNPRNPWIQLEAMRLAVELRQPQAAMRYFAAALKPEGREVSARMLGDWDLFHLAAAAQAQLGDYGEAEAAITHAIKCKPQPLLYGTKAAFAFHRGDHVHADVYHHQALALPAPDGEDQHLQGEIHLLNDQWLKGWKLWDARLQFRRTIGNNSIFRTLPQWTGKLLGPTKRLLVWGEQGQGDQIQFGRFLRAAKATSGAALHLMCYPTLREWFEPLILDGTLDSINAITREDQADAQVAMLSLPRHLGIFQPKILPPPYAPPLALVPSMGRIGYCWRGNALHANDHDRSHHDREEFCEQLGATEAWVNLTKEDEDGPKGTWMDTARLVATCQAVVTVDTGIAHLAGSLGVPTVIICPSSREWRWGNRGAKSAWYPSARLVRKTNIHSWYTTLIAAREALAEMTK